MAGSARLFGKIHTVKAPNMQTNCILRCWPRAQRSWIPPCADVAPSSRVPSLLPPTFRRAWPESAEELSVPNVGCRKLGHLLHFRPLATVCATCKEGPFSHGPKAKRGSESKGVLPNTCQPGLLGPAWYWIPIFQELSRLEKRSAACWNQPEYKLQSSVK